MRAPDTSEQNRRIDHVIDRTGCTPAQALRELEAEEWDTGEATRRIRLWLAEPTVNRPAGV